MFSIDKLFAPKEDVILTEEEQAIIGANLMIDHPEIWRTERKYFYNRINECSRKMASCSKEELASLQDKVQLYIKIMRDFEQMKEKYLKNVRKKDKLKVVKDIWYYITNQDVKDHISALKKS